MTSSTPPTSAPVLSTSAFLDTIGLNVHMGYVDTVYNNVSLVESSLSYLGVDNVRDGIPTATWMHGDEQLAAAGIKFDFLLQTAGGTVDLPANISRLDGFEKNYTGSIRYIEGANEVNLGGAVTYQGGNALPNEIALQHDLYAAVKADPTLASTPVLNMTLGTATTASYSLLGNLSSIADMGTAHSYAPYGNAPSEDYSTILNIESAPTAGEATVISEAGYSTAPATLSGVDQTVQAKYTLDLLMDGAKNGVPATYLYELLDEKPDATGTNMQEHYGLFNNDGTPKLAATAVHNLTTILSTGASATSAVTGKLAYSLSGFATTDSQVLLQKNASTYDLTIWSEPTIWNYKTQSEVVAPSHVVSVALGSVASSVSVYDPLLGTTAIATYTNVSSINVSISDHPLIVEITTPPAPVVPPATPPVISSHSTGTSAAGGALSNSSVISLSGRATAGAVVSIMDGTVLLGNVTAQSNGLWSFTSATLADGSHTFSAVSNSASSSPLAMTIDTTAPLAPVFTVCGKNGAVGALTNSNTLVLTGTAEASGTLVVYDGTKKLGTTTVASNGTWQFSTAKLSDGSHSFTTTETDVAGNTSKAGPATIVKVDTVAPVANLKSGSEAVTGVRLAGTAEPLSLVTISDPTQPNSVIQLTAASSGAWSTTVGTSASTRIVTMTATDAAGNVGASALFAMIAGVNGGTVVAQNNSVVIASPQADTFEIKAGFQNETITGFAVNGAAHDTLSFDVGSFTNLSSLIAHASQVGQDTVISVDSTHTLTMRGIALSTLTASNVIIH